MSTTIYSKELPITTGSQRREQFTITRFAMGNKSQCKCGYRMSIGNERVTLDAKQMENLMQDLNVFFYAEGFP